MTTFPKENLKFPTSLTGVFVPLMIALFLLFFAVSESEADGESILFEGIGQGTWEVQNAEECARKGRCEVEVDGTFEALDGDIGGGTARFRFTDNMSGVSSGASRCSVPAVGDRMFIWETSTGDGLVMMQTSGYICPSPSEVSGEWKRFLRVDRGTGRFEGARGTLFMSGRTNFDTGEVTWTFEGWITVQEEREIGCFRTYLIGSLLMIPPKGAPPPGAVDFTFWLCGDDISVSGPNPRQGYPIFNPQN